MQDMNRSKKKKLILALRLLCIKHHRFLSRVERLIEGFIVLTFTGFLGYLVWHMFLVASFNIPTESMLPTLRPGDKVFVDKVTTGARLFDVFDAAEGKPVRIRRTYQFRKYKVGDIIVFNFPFKGEQKRIEFNYPLYYAKRCVGLPGDTVEIRDYSYFVNGNASVGGGSKRRMRFVFGYDSLSRDSIPGFKALRFRKGERWTIKDLGPLYIPRQGELIRLDSTNYLPYRKAVEWETGKRLKLEEDGLKLGEKKIDRYKFKKNYYFVAGDNAANSSDSRYWGFVPEEFIVGRILFLWKRGGKYGIYWNFDSEVKK